MFSKIVIWGHKLHSHTTSYVFNGFYRGFKYLGYEVHWFDDKDNITGIDFTNCLFITEERGDKGIPKLKDSYYVLHNCNKSQYTNIIPENHILTIQVYTNTMDKGAKPIKNSIYESYIPPPHNIIFMPWATDLLPEEINNVISRLDDIERNESKKVINFVGMILGHWYELKDECSKHGIEFRECGGFSGRNVSMEKNIELIQQSYVSPALQEKWQVDNGYIPCRIFKNISYGKIGGTNNPTVYELFNKEIPYNSNIRQLFYNEVDYKKNLTREKKIKLMEFVRDNHTYINRINNILWFFEKFLGKLKI